MLFAHTKSYERIFVFIREISVAKCVFIRKCAKFVLFYKHITVNNSVISNVLIKKNKFGPFSYKNTFTNRNFTNEYKYSFDLRLCMSKKHILTKME